MRKLIVTGRLGGDPEVKLTQSNKNYTTFRVASQEYGEENTMWFTVTVWDSALQHFCTNLKKGTSVIIDGDYSDHTYVSKISNQVEISRDIRANSVYFGALPLKDDSNMAQQPTVTTQPVQAAPTTQKQSKAKAAVAEQAPSVDDDDLPF